MGHLKLTLLGPFEATSEGAAVRLPASGVACALLAYLAVEAHSTHRREILAALLYPEQPDREALAHLRRTLFDLRQALGDDDPQQPLLLVSRETIRLNPAAGVELDVTAFTQALGATSAPSALPLDPDAVARLEGAVALYRGEFLGGLAVDSAPFEEWALLKREQLHWQALGALQVLAAAYEAQGNYRQAERCARRQLALQPWQEEAHQQLMRALALGGQRSAALAQYQVCVERLEAELGVAPADETVALHQAIRSGALTRVEAGPPGAVAVPAITPRPFTPAVFVSRGGELAKLEEFLDGALAGEGRVAFVRGMAGGGKTALLAQFARQAMVRHPELVAVGGNCNAYAGSGDPYLPFREILQLMSGEIEAHRAGGSLSPEHARRLWGLLPVTAQALATVGPDLVGTFVPGEPLLRRIQAFAPDGTARRERLEALARREGRAPSQADLFDQVTRVVHAVAAQHPLLLLLDDLQWADQGTVSLLFHLGRRLGGGRMLVVGAYRTATVAMGSSSPGTIDEGEVWERHALEPVVREFARNWGDIEIDLDRADGRAFVEAFVDTEPNRLDAAFRETLYQHTEGNPLFTIELLRGLQEWGALVRDEEGRWVAGPALHWRRLPARVEAVIAERLGRLPAECQRLLSVASVEGLEFTAEVLASVTGLGLSRVIYHLSETLGKQHRLVRPSRLLRRAPGGQTLSRYRFAHILFQRYAYDHVDEVARAHLHRLVAEALEGLRVEGATGAEVDAQDPAGPQQLARHWEAAGRFDKAAACLLQAGNRAGQLSAYGEAVQLLRQGLALVGRLPEGSERAQLQKQLLIGLARPLLPVQGWASAERAQLAQQALDLERQGPANEADLIGALYLDAEILSARGKFAEALDLAELLLFLAQRSDTPAYVALGYYARGWGRFFSGCLAESISDLRQALAIYDRPRHAPLLPWVDADLGVGCLSILALALCYMGYADQALSCSRQALAQARELARPLVEAEALTFGGCGFHALRWETQTVQEMAHRLIELAEQKDLPMFRPFALIHQSWAQALGGGDRPTIAQIRDGLAAWRAMGHRSGTPFLLGLLAEMLQHSGAWDEALSTAEEALALAVETGAPHRPDLYRLKGELLTERPAPTGAGQPPDADEAEACFHMAINEARQIGAKLLELRATVSLARVWAGQGKRAEAHRALAEIYGWFSEGFDTPDLQAAKALLDTLS